MTPERLAELKKYCELWGGKDYKGFEIKEIRWLLAEVERLRDLHRRTLDVLSKEFTRVPESHFIEKQISVIKEALEDTP